MTRSFALLALCSLLALGCQVHPPVAQAPFVDLGTSARPRRWDARGLEAILDSRKPGDFAVFRISGSFRDHPALFTQRIVAREGAIVVIDYTLDENGRAETLRVSYDLVAGPGGDAFDVAWVTRAGLRAAPHAAYDRMLAKTMLSADDNEGLIDTESTEVQVLGRKIACERATWRVAVGTEKATLKLTEGVGFAWGAIDGEIRTLDGALVYKAELVETGESDPSRPIFVAAVDLDDPE